MSFRLSAITDIGRQRLRMIARQLRKAPYELTMNVAKKENVPKAMSLAMHLIRENAIPPAKIGVGVNQQAGMLVHSLQIVLTRKARN